MNKFLFKSTDADFQKLYQFLMTINKNVLYLTRQTDLCVKWLKEMNHDDNLQQQVDKYFERGEDSEPGLEDSRNKEDND